MCFVVVAGVVVWFLPICLLPEVGGHFRGPRRFGGCRRPLPTLTCGGKTVVKPLVT